MNLKFGKNLRFFLIGGLIILTVISCSNWQKTVQTGETQPHKNPPNIVMIAADDMGYSDLSLYGGEVSTPNIDALAEAGMMLTNFRAAPTCSPTRSMMLSGVDNHLAGLGTMGEYIASNQKGKPGYEGYLNDRVVALPRLLKDAGYHTYIAGKWHLGKKEGFMPSDRGFEQTFTLLEGAGHHYSNMGYNPARPVATYYSNGKPLELPDNFYSTNSYTDKLIEFLEGDSEDDQPFFVFAAYTSPHDPLQAPQESIQKYIGKYDIGWDKLREQRFKRMKDLGLISPDLDFQPRWERVPAWDGLTPEQQKYESKKMAIYAAMIDNLDQNIGRLIDYLKEIGEYDNTIILFLSDNGPEGADRPERERWKTWLEEEDIDNSYENIGSGNSFVAVGEGWAQVSSTPFLWYKGRVTEGGLRVPAIVTYPGVIEAGTRSDALASVVDIMPTLLQYAGVEHPGTRYDGREIYPMDGRSMRPVLDGESDEIYGENDPVAFELFGNGNSALIMGDWKIIRQSSPWGDGEWQLFNLGEDPRELNDLSEQYPERLTKMIALYEEYEQAKGVVQTTEVLY